LLRVQGFARRLTGDRVAVALTWLLMLPVGLFGLAHVVGTTLVQLGGGAEMVDLVALYTGGRLLLDTPSQLYDPVAELRLQTIMHAGALPLLQFWNPPHVALLMAPLALLPFGAAYVLVLVVNLACLAGACYLLAPRSTRTWAWLGWALALALFLPVQVGLLMGQLSCALLFGFAVFVRLSDRGSVLLRVAALLVWTTKPQLLPILLVALACKREWRTLGLLCAVPVLLSVPVVFVGGWSLVLDYVELGQTAAAGVLSAETTTLYSGHSLLGLAQWLLGPGVPANTLTGLTTLGVCLLVAHAWRDGLRTDARRHLQLASLPLAAGLCSPHALAYDDVIWLASAWLLLRFAREVPGASGGVVTVVLVGWWGGNLAALPGAYGIAPWGAFTAIVCLACIAWLARLYSLAAPQSSAWGGTASAAASSATSVW
jgi:hypothetical protein